MNSTDFEELKKLIDQAEVISFDVFDTLIFRKTNTPETIFDLLGKKYMIPGFQKLRKDAQNEASRRAYEKYQYPHATMDQIYEVLSERTDICKCWEQVKSSEIELEEDALRENSEMKQVYQYARSRGKRIIAVTDMYLFAKDISRILEREGYHLDYIYCSADEHKAKFNKELFAEVAKKERVPYERILHIGDNQRDDVEYPSEFGIVTFHYKASADLEKIENLPDSDIDKGLFKLLYNNKRGFWYNLGVEVGGPLYLGLTLWLSSKLKASDKKIYFLSRDGYNLWNIFDKLGIKNSGYLFSSRRSLLLSGIEFMTEEDINDLPPYVTGQTIGEILDYLCVPRDKIAHLHEAGFNSFDEIITDASKCLDFKKLYRLDKEVFLERGKCERENAQKYLKSIGFLDGDAYIFDCGWNGSSQFLLDKLLNSLKYKGKVQFYYFGILNTDKSRRQLHGKHYEAFAFDFFKNYFLQPIVKSNPLIYELFFSAPQGSLLYYDGIKPVLEGSDQESYKKDLLDGIMDYVMAGFDFATKYHITYYPAMAVSHLNRLITNPTVEEAKIIGDLENPDGFTHKDGITYQIGYINQTSLDHLLASNLYWIPGIMKRDDISCDIKKKFLEELNITYHESVKDRYNLESWDAIRNYERWRNNCQIISTDERKLSYFPQFSIVMPVYNTVTEQLKAAIDSALAQSYQKYELILIDDHSSWDNVRKVLGSYESNSHVKVIYRNVNGNISVATNDGLAQASGDFIVFMDCDDILEKEALYECAEKLTQNPDLDFIYSDEDKITEDGLIRHMPFFKPEWSPDLFLSMMYTNHLGVYRASIVKEIGGLRTAYNGSQDYDMTLRFMEHSANNRVGHIPKVLYHWRERKESVALSLNAKNYASEAALAAKEDYFHRNHIEAKMEVVEQMSQGYPVYDTAPNPLVSIIIPSKDHAKLLIRCLSSIKEFTNYKNYELIIVDNGSTEEERRKIESVKDRFNFIYTYEKFEFNFSKMCNIGARKARGEYLLFLNDDIEAFSPVWLERMLGQAMQKHTGAVGAKLFYPETNKIQHAGIFNGTHGPEHCFLMKDDSIMEYFGWNRIVTNYIAVTGACLLINVHKFFEVGGFDESFPVAYNDVELCFKLYEHGYYNVLRCDAVAYHHESFSRGLDTIDNRKYVRLIEDLDRLYKKHPDLKKKDPFLNVNLPYYTDLLVPINNVDSMKIVEQINGRSDKIRGYVDGVNRYPYENGVPNEDKIEVFGWMLLPERKDNAFLKKYLLLRDPYGTTYQIPAHSVERLDIMEWFNNQEDKRYCGFQCLASKSQLRLDYIPYDLGVAILEPDGTQHVKWMGFKNEVFYCKDEYTRKGAILSLDVKSLDCKSVLKEADSNIKWGLDQVEEDKNGVLHIFGWAYVNIRQHFQYRPQILLEDENKKLYQLTTRSIRRADMALTTSNQKFLYKVGFGCNVVGLLLPAHHTYEVIISLENQFRCEKLAVHTGKIFKRKI
jgi:HAD superfamily hydrolase (TIGR01549 family)